MGFILDNEYYPEEADVPRLRNRQQKGFKQWDHQRQRKDYAKEILQPYNRNGTPNSKFIDAYPEESKGYGFLPKDEELDGKN